MGLESYHEEFKYQNQNLNIIGILNFELKLNFAVYVRPS